MVKHSRGHLALWVGFLAMALFAMSLPSVEADEVPAFFLKIAKNIPRVGRSDRFEDYFRKSVKNIPRIGRRDGYASPSDTMSAHSDNAPFTGPAKRMINIPTSGGDDPTWSHFPLAIEGPPELWRTLAGYTNGAGYGSDDIDNEIWQRDKRTGDGPASL